MVCRALLRELTAVFARLVPSSGCHTHSFRSLPPTSLANSIVVGSRKFSVVDVYYMSLYYGSALEWSAIASLAVQKITASDLHLVQQTINERQIFVRPLPPVQNLQNPHDLTVGQGTFEY
jgi:hypothetical protein